MKQAAAVVRDGVLVLGEGAASEQIAVGGVRWFDWLTQATRFSFVGASGSFSAHRERYQRGGWYWRAYRRQHGQLYRLYLGKAEALTLAQLQATAAALAQRSRDAADARHAPNQGIVGEAVGVAAVVQAGEAPHHKNRAAAARQGMLHGKSLPIAAAKLAPPRLPVPLVERPALLEQLEAALQGGFTLIVAPAGYGKTTLLASWLRRAELIMKNEEWRKLDREDTSPFSIPNSQFKNEEWRKLDREDTSPFSIPNSQFKTVWLTLDASDDAPARFYTSLSAALHQRYGEALDPPTVAADLSADDMLYAMLQMLAAVPHDLTLILDNYQVVRNEAVQAFVAALIEQLPPNFHLVLVSRSEPPLPLPRLRLRGQVNELRSADLAFTAGEVAQFCMGVARLNLNAPDLELLARRSEGWVGGLKLIGDTLRRQPSTGSRLATVIDQHPDIMAYLEQEVFAQQPALLQRFLLDTSIVDELNVPLCDALTGRSDSATLLESLLRGGVLLRPLDATRSTYRYHPLWARFLRARLAQLQPDACAALHRLAMQWYSLNGDPARAIDHALAGAAYDDAARLIVAHAPQLFARGHMEQLLGWLTALPEPLVLAHLRLSLIHVWALLLSGRWNGLETRLRAVAHLWLQPTPAASAANEAFPAEAAALAPQPELLVLRAVLLMGRGDTDGAAAAMCQSERSVAPEDVLLQGMLAMIGSGIAQAQGDNTRAQQLLAQAQLLGLAQQSSALALLALSHQAHMLAVQGRLNAARLAYKRVIDLSATNAEASTAVRGMAAIGLAGIAYERNLLGEAAAYARQGIADGERAHSYEILAIGYSILAQVAQAQGDAARARAMLDAGEALIWRHPVMPHVMLYLSVGRAALALAQGDAAAAATWMHGYEQQASLHLQAQSERAHIAMARVLLAQGQAEQALALLERVRASAERSERHGILLPVLLGEALAYQACGQLEAAEQRLEAALVHGVGEGYVRSFVDAGAKLVPLLRRAEARSAEPAYLRRVLVLCAQLAPDAPTMVGGRRQALTEREREVLRLLAEGASNAAIAQRLTVSLSTVKKHLSGIFAKLGVSNRTQAVARARLLELL